MGTICNEEREEGAILSNKIVISYNSFLLNNQFKMAIQQLIGNILYSMATMYNYKNIMS